MIHKVVISTPQQAFEFIGEIVEFTDEYILLKASQGDIYVERKYLVFVQYINEEEAIPAPVVRPQKIEQVEKAPKKPLKIRLVPPSQLPDDDEDIYYGTTYDDQDDNMEVLKNVLAGYGTDSNLKDAAKAVMSNEDEEFAVGGVKYQSPLQTVLGLKNEPKKVRDR